MNKITKLIARKPQESAMHKLTQKMVDSTCMIWLTMIGYIIYLEFFKDVV